MSSSPLRNIHDQLNVGVIVVIGPTGDLNVLIGHPDIVGVGLEILRRGHDGELDGPLISERFICPFSHGANLFNGGDAIISNENLHRMKSSVLVDILELGDVNEGHLQR